MGVSVGGELVVFVLRTANGDENQFQMNFVQRKHTFFLKKTGG
jgi:hypothetical protein